MPYINKYELEIIDAVIRRVVYADDVQLLDGEWLKNAIIEPLTIVRLAGERKTYAETNAAREKRRKPRKR